MMDKLYYIFVRPLPLPLRVFIADIGSVLSYTRSLFRSPL